MTNKAQQRKILKERLASLPQEDACVFSRTIAEKILSEPLFSAARSIFIYRSMPTEPNTEPIIQRALALGKEVYLPRIDGENMFMVRYRTGERMLLNRYGIEEPQGEPYLGQVDLALIPLLGFDRNKSRLGRGKDRLAIIEGSMLFFISSASLMSYAT